MASDDGLRLKPRSKGQVGISPFFFRVEAKLLPRIATKFLKFENQVNIEVFNRHKTDFFFFFWPDYHRWFFSVTKNYRIMIKNLYFLFGL